MIGLGNPHATQTSQNLRKNNFINEAETILAPVASNIHISESQIGGDIVSPQLGELQSESEAIYTHIRKSSESKILYQIGQNQPDINLFDQEDNISYAASEPQFNDPIVSPDIKKK